MKKALFASVLFLMSASVQAGLESLKSATLKDQKRNQRQDFRTPAPAPVAQAADAHLTNAMHSSIVKPANLSNKRKSTNVKGLASPETLIPTKDGAVLDDTSFNNFSISQNGTNLYTGSGSKSGHDYAMYDNSTGNAISRFDTSNADINLRFSNTNGSPIYSVVTAVSDIRWIIPSRNPNLSVYPVGNPNNPDPNGPMINMSNPDIQNGAGTAPKAGLHFDFSSISSINGNPVKGVRMADFSLCIDLKKFTSSNDIQNIYAYWGQYDEDSVGVLPITDVATNPNVNYAPIFTLDPEDFGITFSGGTPVLPANGFSNGMGTYSSSIAGDKVDRCIIRIGVAIPCDCARMEWLFIAPGIPA